MRQFAQFCKKYRLVLTGFGVALAALFVLCWTGFQLGREVQRRCEYQILNDEYSVAAEIPAEGVAQTFVPPANAELYGVRLDFATYGRIVRGRVTVTLESQAGEWLAEKMLPAETLLDNTFADVVFDASPTAVPAGEALSLRVAFVPETAEDVLGVWCAGEQANDVAGNAMPVQGAPGTLALQVITEYSGSWSVRLFLPLAALLLAAVLLGWWLLFAQKQPAKLTTVFCLEAALLGGAFCLVTPPLVAPDEYAHVAGSYALASRVLGQTPYDENGNLLMRACDAAYMTDETGDVGIFAYKRAARHLPETGNDGRTETPTRVRVSTTNVNLLYAPQTLGVLAARVLGLGFFAMLLLGRLCNLALYILLCRFALAHLPHGKNLLLCIALLPMGLQLAASFSADALVIGLVFGYLALCLECVQRPATRTDLIGLVVFAALIGPSKAIYIITVGLCFIIPADHLGGRKKALAFKAGCCVAAALGWMSYNGGYFDYIYRDVDYMGVQRFAAKAAAVAVVLGGIFWAIHKKPKARKIFFWVLAGGVVAFLPVGYYMLSHMWGGLTPDEIAAGIQPNGDSIYTFTIGYICRNIPGTLKILLNTVGTQGPVWLQGILGLSLGEPIVYPVEVSWLYGIGLVLVLLVAALRTAGDAPRLPGARRWVIFGVGLGVAALSMFACLTWTPINYTVLFGVQGRYFLPVLPLLLLPLGDSRALTKSRSLAAETSFAGVCLCALVILQGAFLYAGM